MFHLALAVRPNSATLAGMTAPEIEQWLASFYLRCDRNHTPSELRTVALEEELRELLASGATVSSEFRSWATRILAPAQQTVEPGFASQPTRTDRPVLPTGTTPAK